METEVSLSIKQSDCVTTSVIKLDSIQDIHDALEFETRRILSLVDRHIGLPSVDARYWDSNRKITIRQKGVP